MIVLAQNWQMWCVFAIVAIAVYFYVRESFSIEAISISVIVALMLFFHIFVIDNTAPNLSQDFTTDILLSGFAAPALITIMALLVIGQGMFQTGALEGPIAHMDIALDRAPRQTMFFVFIMVFAISMFMNNTPVVVMFIPIFIAMSAKLGHETSRYLMPLSFLSILAGMTTLIGSSTNLLVNDILQRSTNMSLGFFSQFWPGMALAAIGAVYIIIFAPILLPRREKSVTPAGPQGQQRISQMCYHWLNLRLHRYG